MRKIILVGHGEGCIGTKKSVEMIIGRQDQLIAVPLNISESPHDYYEKLNKIIIDESQKGKNNILILADIKGGTPCNISTIILNQYKNIELISGYHLGLIIQACISQQLDADWLLKETTSMIQKISKKETHNGN